MSVNREQFLDDEFESPRGPLEARVAEIQAGVLGVDRIGRADSFYDFGGTSLQAIRICARIERELDCRALPVWLFESDVLADFCGRLEAKASGSADDPGDVHVHDAPPATPPETNPVAPGTIGHPLSFAQQRLWLIDRLTPDRTEYNMFEAYRLLGDVDRGTLRAALADTIDRHAMLRTTFHSSNGVPYQMISEKPTTPFESITVTGDPESQAVIDREVRRPFRLDEAPLLRMKLLRLGAGHHVILLVTHHIVADDWSLDVFWHDFCAHYRARVTASPAELDPLPVQYVDYAARQRDSLRGATLDGYLDYWRTHLGSAPLILDLPTDFPRSERRNSTNAVVEFTLPAPTTRAVAELAQKAHATPFMVLLAAFGASIALAAGQDDFIVGTFAANRPSVELERLVGLFVNLLPLYMRCADELTFGELLEQVRSIALGAYRHQEMPFDHLVADLRPPRDLTRNPLVQVAFQSFKARPSRITLPGVRCTLVREGQGGNALDLLAIVQEDGDCLTGELHYRDDLFSRSTALAFAARFVRVAAVATGQPDQRLSTLPWEEP